MPKVRRQRTKYHFSKADAAAEKERENDMELPEIEAMEEASAEDGKLPLPDASRRSNDTTGMSKKARRESRKNDWLKKVGAIHSRQLEEKAAEKRRKTAVVGDIMPLQNALDEVAQILVDPETLKEQTEKQKLAKARVVSRNKRQMVLADECKKFRQVVSHEQFKADPLKAIGQHLKAAAKT